MKLNKTDLEKLKLKKSALTEKWSRKNIVTS